MKHQIVKPPRDNIKTILKNIVVYYWESIIWKWDDLSFLGK